MTFTHTIYLLEMLYYQEYWFDNGRGLWCVPTEHTSTGGVSMDKSTRKYVLTGLMTALVFVLTFLIKIPVPFTSGYIHLGDSMIYISVIVLGPVFGAFASGVGSMLADVIGGYVQYALPTLIIKSLMALVMGLVLSGKTRKASIASVVTALSVWIAFSGGTIVFLKNQIQNSGQSRIVEQIVGADADAAAFEQANQTLNHFPAYLAAGIAVLLVIFALGAYWISKREGNKFFTVKAIIGMVAAGMCMVMGYFLIESFMYTPVAALLSIPMNMIQFFGGVAAASLFMPAIQKAHLIAEK